MKMEVSMIDEWKPRKIESQLILKAEKRNSKSIENHKNPDENSFSFSFSYLLEIFKSLFLATIKKFFVF